VVPGRRRWRMMWQIGNGVAAACVAAAVLVLCAAGFAGVPAIGRALDPGRGAWASAAGGELPKPAVLNAAGLTGPALVSFDPHGIATVQAGRLADAMLALGYLHARLRLTQMDLQRRVAEGRLSQIVGAGALPSDRFELRLGLLRTARREWAALPRNGTEARLLTAYARGVNDYLAQLRSSGQWPAAFSLAGVYPARWTPVDSLAVQGYLAQEIDYTTSPLDYAVLAGSLGLGRTMRWFPVLPAGPGQPFDRGPYRAGRLAPPGAAVASRRATASGSPAVAPSAAVVRSAQAALALSRNLPRGQAARQPLGGAWAVNGPKVRGGGSMLAGTAALPGLFPSGWFQAAVTAPGYDVTGVSLPGLPGIFIGHNKRIAWTLTDAQSQSALYYVERTSRGRAGDYFWHGQWRPMRRLRYAIPVRGGATRQLTVDLTAHGPLLTGAGTAGPAISVDWMGAGGSPDVAVLAGIGAAGNFTQFHAALASWRSPSLTFVYADRGGNIGALTAGSFPIVRAGAPWMPLTGTGAGDVAGLVPYDALPLSYNPAAHVVAAGGQRPVTAAYPYYLGTSANDLDAADRAGADMTVLRRRARLQPASVVPLQTSPGSELAARLLPRLLAAVRHAHLTSAERSAASLLRHWNHQLAPASAAAAIWSVFWPDYLTATFGPWWRAAGVPVLADPAGLGVSPSQAGLAGALEHWTLADPSNPVFRPPGVKAGTTATTALRAAFGAAVAQLTAELHGPPPGWRLDALAAAPVVSAAQVPVLGYGSRAATGPWLVPATAAGAPGLASAAALATSAGAPGWRMIVQLTPGHGGVMAEGIYPGGQSDNPASLWHDNLTARWQAGGYLLMPPAGSAVAGPMRWEFLP
jgi:penicillin G amidase